MSDPTRRCLCDSARLPAVVLDPGLFSRRDGESRTGNFPLWNPAWIELDLTETPWPDCGGVALDEALAAHVRRRWRFGRVRHPGHRSGNA